MKKQFISVAGLLALFAISQVFISSTGKESNQKTGDSTVFGIWAPAIPAHLEFAGEKLPLEDFEVKERLDKEILVNTYWQSQTFLIIKKTNRFFPQIEVLLKANGIPDDFKYLALAESALSNVVSPAGASGFWQFMEETGKKYGLEINDEVDERYDLEKSTLAACRYLKDSYAQFKNWTLVAASYNMGPAGVRKQLQAQGVDSYYDLYLNNETSRYILRIMAMKQICQNPALYGYNFKKEDLYAPIPVDLVKVDTAVVSWPLFALKQGTNYKMLKTLNPWMRTSYMKNKHNKTYYVSIPKVRSNSKPDGKKQSMMENVKPVTDTIFFHQVRSNEDIQVISTKYKVKVQEILDWNGLKTSKLKTGQKLKIIQQK
jgi:membrane-bound lytic murein transglycosylase D